MGWGPEPVPTALNPRMHITSWSLYSNSSLASTCVIGYFCLCSNLLNSKRNPYLNYRLFCINWVFNNYLMI